MSLIDYLRQLSPRERWEAVRNYDGPTIPRQVTCERASDRRLNVSQDELRKMPFDQWLKATAALQPGGASHEESWVRTRADGPCEAARRRQEGEA